MKKILFLICVLFLQCACQDSKVQQPLGKFTLFPDAIEAPGFSQNIKYDFSAPKKDFDFQPVNITWSHGKMGEEMVYVSNNSFGDLSNSIVEINYYFGEPIENPKLLEFSRQIQKATRQKPNKSGWKALSGDWIAEDDFIRHKTTPNTEGPHGIIVNNENSFKNGAISLNFEFENAEDEKKTGSEFIGVLFRSGNQLSKKGYALKITRSGEIHSTVIKDGKEVFSSKLSQTLPFIKSGKRNLTLFICGDTLTLVYEGQNIFFPPNPILPDQTGFMGIITNTHVRIWDTSYGIARDNISGAAKEQVDQDETPFAQSLGLNLKINNDNFFYQVNKKGLLKIFKNGALQDSRTLGYAWVNFGHKDHIIKIMNTRGGNAVFFDDLLVGTWAANHENISPEINILKGIKPGVALNSVKIAGIKGETDHESLVRKQNIKSIRKNFKWEKRTRDKSLVVGEYTLGHDTHRAILVQTPSELTFPVQIPPGAFLNFSFAVPRESWTTGKGVIFEVHLKEKGKEDNKILFSEKISPGEVAPLNFHKRRWHEQRVDLSQFAGLQGTMVFTARSEGAKEITLAPQFALWGDPGIFPRRKEDEYNVLLISIDTLRADHLSCYGYESNTSPNIDAMAGEGATFYNAFAQSPWTLPSHLSLFTSLYPSALKAGNNEGWALSNPETSLALILQENNYLTASFNESGFVDSDYGFSQGFNSKYHNGLSLDSNFNNFKKWTETHREDRFFVFFHTYHVHEYIDIGKLGGRDLHRLYSPAYPGSEKLLKHYIDKYDSKIEQIDDFFGNLVSYLKKSGLYDKTLIIITSDHGESFGEHRGSSDHGHYLYNEALRVPLIFRLPGKVPSGFKTARNVRLIDIQPTILDILGIKTGKYIEGKSLSGFFKGSENKNRPIFSEAMFTKSFAHIPLKSLQKDGYKLILAPVETAPNHYNYDIKDYGELYNIKDDINEKDNLNEKGSEITGSMKREIQSIIDQSGKINRLLKAGKPGKGKDVPVSENTKARLKALGYIQ